MPRSDVALMVKVVGVFAGRDWPSKSSVTPLIAPLTTLFALVAG